MSKIKNPIRIGIVGYGNLGKGVEKALDQNPDMRLTAIFTRRDPESLSKDGKMMHYSTIKDFVGKIDVMILCGGSATDLPKQVPEIAQWFHTVDSYDNHAKIPEYFDQVNQVAQTNKTLSLISTGWDPGLFSLARVLGQSILPEGKDYTFWGRGVSQGHSDAVRRVDGVKNAVQYTIPLDSALEKVREGEQPDLSAADRHERICYVVPEEGADISEIETAIKTMPHYFEPYRTTVHFITEEELLTEHSSMPHGGIVFRTGRTGEKSRQRIEFNLALEDNPEFTSSVLVAYARAVFRMADRKSTRASCRERVWIAVGAGWVHGKSNGRTVARGGYG